MTLKPRLLIIQPGLMWLAAARRRLLLLLLLCSRCGTSTVSPFPLGEQAEESRAGEATGGPGGSLCPLPKGDIGRVPVWSTVESLAKCYYPELAHLRDGNGLLADYAFPKGTCPGESPSDLPPRIQLCHLSPLWHSWIPSVCFVSCSCVESEAKAAACWSLFSFRLVSEVSPIDLLLCAQPCTVWLRIWQGNISCNYIYLLQLAASGPSLRLPEHTGFFRVKTKWTIILSTGGLENKIMFITWAYTNQSTGEITLNFRSTDHSSSQMEISAHVNRY